MITTKINDEWEFKKLLYAFLDIGNKLRDLKKKYKKYSFTNSEEFLELIKRLRKFIRREGRKRCMNVHIKIHATLDKPKDGIDLSLLLPKGQKFESIYYFTIYSVRNFSLRPDINDGSLINIELKYNETDGWIIGSKSPFSI